MVYFLLLLIFSLGSSASVYLQTDWKLSASQVDGFLKIWLGTSADSVRVIKKLARELLSVDEGRKPPNSSTFKSCTDANFHVWYSAMISGLSHYAYKNVMIITVKQFNIVIIIFTNNLI